MTGTEVQKDKFGRALDGFDAVSFFKRSRPEMGQRRYQVEYRGAKWYFTSEENKHEFSQNPEKFTPQCDGFCAFAAMFGGKGPGRGKYGKVKDGKLYLNANSVVQTIFHRLKSGPQRAKEQWEKVRAMGDQAPTSPLAVLKKKALRFRRYIYFNHRW